MGASEAIDTLLTMAPPDSNQCRQEGLGDPVGAEEVDRQVPFERVAVAEVIELRRCPRC